MEKLTLETLPAAVTQLTLEIGEIKRLLLERAGEGHQDTHVWFDLVDLCTYLPDKPAKATVYGWIHSGAIPCHKGGKKLRFLKSEIDVWLKTAGKRKSALDFEKEAGNYIINKNQRKII